MKTKSQSPLNLKLVSNTSPYLSPDQQQKLMQPRRLSSYFVIFIESGSIMYNIDLQEQVVTAGQILFATPNQFFVPPPKDASLKYFKVLFDENTLALLPQQFPCLLNPLNTQVVSFGTDAQERIKKVFAILNQLLQGPEPAADTEIALTYLNTLLSELNTGYFKNTVAATTINSNLSKFIEFKLVVETQLTEQPSVQDIAQKLSLSTNSLYRIVKEYTGISPKDFFTQRLMLEAQRKLKHAPLSVKELAYELGFNDPDYFSRFFKKCTGKSITEFLEGPQDS